MKVVDILIFLLVIFIIFISGCVTYEWMPANNISIETSLIEHNINSLSELGQASVHRFDYTIKIAAINRGSDNEHVKFTITMLNPKGTKEFQSKEFEINDLKPNEIFESEIHLYDAWSIQDPIIKVSNICVIREMK